MRILLTGGSGFIGRNLRAYLSAGHDVLAPTHAELDLADPIAIDTWFAQHELDAVVHGAVRPGHRNAPDPTHQLWMNLRMFFGLLRNKHRFGKLLFLSSGAVYDITRDLDRVSEDDLGKSLPADEHGLSKYVIARHIEELARGGVDIVELRLFGIFGKHEDYAIRFISNAICKALFDLPITLRQNRTFSYLYVDDLGPIVEWFLVGGHAHCAYNVVPDDTHDLLTLAHRVQSRAGISTRIEVAAAGNGMPYSADNRRLRQTMPNVQFTPIASAIDALYAWYEANRATIDRDALLVDK